MSKRLLFLFAALGLLAGLGFVSPCQASSIPFNYTVAVVPPASPTGTLAVGVASSPAPTLTVTAAPAGSGIAAIPPMPSGPLIQIGSFSLNHVPSGPSTSLYSISGTVDDNVTITLTGSYSGTGTIQIVESFNGLVGFVSGIGSFDTIAVTQMTGTPATTVIDGYRFFVDQFFVSGSKKYIEIEASLVPEPTSMALLGIGMTGFFAFRRFFRRTMVD